MCCGRSLKTELSRTLMKFCSARVLLFSFFFTVVYRPMVAVETEVPTGELAVSTFGFPLSMRVLYGPWR